ncbi:Uncharacterised protein [Acinetobacter baumannii]|nr:Uncharacterised protein [Acinetobacter baumannii]
MAERRLIINELGNILKMLFGYRELLSQLP